MGLLPIFVDLDRLSSVPNCVMGTLTYWSKQGTSSQNFPTATACGPQSSDTSSDSDRFQSSFASKNLANEAFHHSSGTDCVCTCVLRQRTACGSQRAEVLLACIKRDCWKLCSKSKLRSYNDARRPERKVSAPICLSRRSSRPCSSRKGSTSSGPIPA